jgi:cytochrome c-type biogenesis protein CcmF
VAALALVAALCFGGVYEHPYALVSFGLCLFVTVTIALEFWKGANAIRAKNEVSLLRAAVELTHRNTRRYGGYIVHMGVVLMFIGFTGAAFNKDRTVQVDPNQDFAIGHYNLRIANVEDGDNDNYEWRRVSVDVRKAGEDLGTMQPEHRFYKSSRQPASEVAIRRRLNEDLYVNFAGMSSDEKKLVIQAYVFPLVSWIWLGYYVLLFGTLVCLVPPKMRLAYARTEVVGIVGKRESVEK